MSTIAAVATVFLFASLGLDFYDSVRRESPFWLSEVTRGTLIVSFLLFGVHHVFISRILWLAVVSIIIAFLLIIQFFDQNAQL